MRRGFSSPAAPRHDADAWPGNRRLRLRLLPNQPSARNPCSRAPRASRAEYVRQRQRSWLDIHNLLSVTALPFHFVITYSGLVFFAFTYMHVKRFHPVPVSSALVFGRYHT